MDALFEAVNIESSRIEKANAETNISSIEETNKINRPYNETEKKAYTGPEYDGTIDIDEYLKSVNWRRHFDQNSQRYYYYDKSSKKTTWNKPQHLIDYENKNSINKEKKLVDANSPSKNISPTTKANTILPFSPKKSSVMVNPLEREKPAPSSATKDSTLRDDTILIPHNSTSAKFGAYGDYGSDDEMEMETAEPKPLALLNQTAQFSSESEDDNIQNQTTYRDRSFSSDDESVNETAPMNRDVESELLIDRVHSIEIERQKHISLLLEKITKPDAILEPYTVGAVKELIINYQQEAKDILERIVNGYVGYPRLCNIALDWAEKAQAIKNNRSSSDRADNNSASVENMALGHLSKLIVQRFDSQILDENAPPEGDSLYSQLGSAPKLKRTLEELYPKHPESIFLARFKRSLKQTISKAETKKAISKPSSGLGSLNSFEHAHIAFHLIVVYLLKSANGESSDLKLTQDIAWHLSSNKYAKLAILRSIKSFVTSISQDFASISKKLKSDGSISIEEQTRRIESLIDPLTQLETVIESFNATEIPAVSPISQRAVDELRSSPLYSALKDAIADKNGESLLHFIELAKTAGMGRWLDLWLVSDFRNLLVDGYKLGNVSLIQEIARADRAEVWLEDVVLGLLTHNYSIPTELSAILVQLDTSSAECHSSEDISQSIERINSLIQDINLMSRDGIDGDKVEELAEIIGQRPIYSFYVLRWLNPSESISKESTKGVYNLCEYKGDEFYAAVTSAWTHIISVILESYQSLFAADVFSCLQLLWNSLLEKTADPELDNSKRDILNVVVDVAFVGDAISSLVLKYLIDQLSSFDPVTVRGVIQSLLSKVTKVFWEEHSVTLIAILKITSVRTALLSPHFRKASLERFRKFVLENNPKIHPTNEIDELKVFLSSIN